MAATNRITVAQFRLMDLPKGQKHELIGGEVVSENLDDEMEPESVVNPVPALAMEIVSDESAAALQAKIDSYLDNGCRTVLVLYPTLRTITLMRPGGGRTFSGDELVEIDWMPGFSVPASRFFEGLAPR